MTIGIVETGDKKYLLKSITVEWVDLFKSSIRGLRIQGRDPKLREIGKYLAITKIQDPKIQLSRNRIKLHPINLHLMVTGSH